LHIGGGCREVSDRLDHAAWCAFEDFARTILSFVGFERLTETAA
jgi:hypothetical protein